MAPLEVFGPPSASPPSSSKTHENQNAAFIHSAREERGSDSAHSDSAAVRTGHRVQPTQIQPATEIRTGGPPHSVCYRRKTMATHFQTGYFKKIFKVDIIDSL